jgi:hypothetical protein
MLVPSWRLVLSNLLLCVTRMGFLPTHDDLQVLAGPSAIPVTRMSCPSALVRLAGRTVAKAIRSTATADQSGRMLSGRLNSAARRTLSLCYHAVPFAGRHSRMLQE